MLLRTRFYLPPLRPNVVLRTALLKRLQDSGGGSLLLISAPAGYGKTTLISQWLHHHPHTFTWLTLGPEHNVIDVFWHYALTALRQILPDVGQDAERLMLAGEVPDYQQVVIALLNDLDQFSINNRASEPVTLVLDDFHLLHNPRLLALINLLLDHLPPCIRVVITARNEPELQLARRRASGQLLQLGIEQLRFDAGETQTFLTDTMGLAAQAQQAARMCARTEGWIAGLQLAALSLQRHGADDAAWWQSEGLDRHIADYLLEEVFAGLGGALQAFLIQTAVASRFCAGLCNAIVGRHDSQQMLLQLEAANLFLVPLDLHRTWFRYHDLFRQFLLQRFGLLPTGEQQANVDRALGWLEQNGYSDDAMELCLAHARWADAVRLLQQDATGLISSEVPAKLARWLRQLPASARAAHPLIQQHWMRVQNQERPLPEAAEPATDALGPLTRQEQSVLTLIERGLSNKAIARELQISLNTLKVHIRNLYGKMGVENRRDILVRSTRRPDAP